MRNLAEGVARFQRDVFPARRDLFARLATRHTPHTLFIGCSDARVVPELITGCEPGELFVVRTAGNLVPAHAPGADGVAASVEYAVTVLGVTDIVVCGHSACGAMTALAQRHDLSAAPAVADWLRHADASVARTTTGDVATLVRRNVLAQLANLATHPSVARALAGRKVTLHGWVFDIGTGHVEVLDATGTAPATAA
ncbi:MULTISPECIES: carbonic anhydrase [Streptomycetaceae]|uniref:Carbonic anhydrase n=1 Tax=Streptantibioticus cattleyicolor (strain ATCC 35852 / DSM 46488 / JCM 4925 / NBRC 14057 / NRRL 8057) TaxID=1003195 RepID=F8K417_STREN|nr:MULTISPECIES: carbonic anhydrase [Streptomycetaceae]AEW92553.1 Carbonate dehydratase [Streptantibioticus cattleyicolor NRRL 8057 = DSM 46488]MYS57341.1 carbonic anhydrase [Streptomyces sp. SID5468]CCB72911.1 Carbonic anhydrase [Streptantibioticus cattleyicolor NRRL 8057 = DSM 46488]